MANLKTSDYGVIPGGIINSTWLFDVANPSVVNYKATFTELQDNVNAGKALGKTITGGTGANENLVFDSTSNATKGQVQLADGSVLHANTTNYETLVTDNNDIPNKKYVDDAVATEAIWDRGGTTVTLQNAGDTVQLDSAGGLQFGPAGQNITVISTDVAFTGAVNTAISSQLAIKTYVDNHSTNGLWTRTGTNVSLTNAGDTVQFDATGGTQFGATGQNITEYSIDGTLADNVDTALPTEKAVKTYVDAHTANGMWTRTGTLISPSTAGDTLDLRTSKGVYLSESSINDIVAATGIVNVDDDIIYIRSSTAGETTITANPQIPPPPDGSSKRVMFIGADNTKTVTFVNGNGLATAGGQPFTLGLNDVLVLVYSTVNAIWIEQYRSDNS